MVYPLPVKTSSWTRFHLYCKPSFFFFFLNQSLHLQNACFKTYTILKNIYLLHCYLQSQSPSTNLGIFQIVHVSNKSVDDIVVAENKFTKFILPVSIRQWIADFLSGSKLCVTGLSLTVSTGSPQDCVCSSSPPLFFVCTKVCLQ